MPNRPLMPSTIKIFIRGEAKEAAKDIRDRPILERVTLDTRSPTELPSANTVIPRMASDISKILPNAFIRPTTSLHRQYIHNNPTKNPTNARKG